MLVFVSFLAGMATVLAPCILPVLPYILLRSDGNPLLRLLPMLLALAGTFTASAYLATLGGVWVITVSEWGRSVGAAILLFAGLGLVAPRLFEFALKPLLAAGNAILSDRHSFETRQNGVVREVINSALIGVGIGLIWVPCAGPVLALILTSTILKTGGVQTLAALLAFAAGVCCSLGVGGLFTKELLRLFALQRRTILLGRTALGVAVIFAATATALNVEGFWPNSGTGSVQIRFEEKLIDLLHPKNGPTRDHMFESRAAPPLGVPAFRRVATAASYSGEKRDHAEGVETIHGFEQATGWLNGGPIAPDALRGKVVLVEFWTFACVNCQHAIPHVNQWAKTYADQGFVVVGVHAPEFAFERRIENVKAAIAKLGLVFPVAIDNDFKIWEAYGNRYWPALYLVDSRGRIRYRHFGEGRYVETEAVIRSLIAES